MKRILFLLLFSAILHSADAQKWQWQVQAGIMGYDGDLAQTPFNIHNLGPAAGAGVRYSFNSKLLLRAEFLYGNIGAHDRNNRNDLLKKRNLSFRNSIMEGQLALEVNLIEPSEVKAYHYVFAGVGVFRHNPYAQDDAGNKVFLKPLSTEGQGLPEYPNRKEYSLTQFCIPFGGGIKINLKNKQTLGIEVGARKIFTDYLDDVSTRYVDFNVLQAHRGPKAVEMSFRSITAGGVQAEPITDDIRGNPKENDTYYYVGVKYILGKKKAGKAKPEKK